MDDLRARYRPYLAMMFLFLVILVGTIFVLRRSEPVAMTIMTATPRPTATEVLILVDVRGAVAKPGVYTLPAGSRVQDALTLAGDLLRNAETRNINLARKLNDGEQIYIPAEGEATPLPAVAPVKSERQPTPPARRAPPVASKTRLSPLPRVRTDRPLTSSRLEPEVLPELLVV